MPFDGLAIRAVTNELNTQLYNARINKIHQPEKDELQISIRQMNAGTINLAISANPRWARMHISTYKKDNPSQAPAFCMLLRKYLEGGKIKEIKQLGLERIVHIKIEALDEFREWKEKILICEFMGRHSNIILINPETGLIIDAIKRYGKNLSTYREILPGEEYINPPGQGKLEPTSTQFEEFVAAMWNQKTDTQLSTALFNVYTGLSPFAAREICTATSMNYAMPVDECGEFELSKIFNHLDKILIDSNNNIMQATVQYKKNIPQEFAPYPLNILSPACTNTTFSSMNEACDKYYFYKLTMLRLESMKANLSKNIKERLDKAYKKKFNQEGDLEKALKNEKYRLWGELLTAYAYKFKKGDIQAVVQDFESGQEIEIPLDPRYTPIQSAQRFFKIYNKSTKAQKHLQQLMSANQENIDYLESVMVSVKQADSPAEIAAIIEELQKEGYLKNRSTRKKVKEEKMPPRRYISSDGLEILVGRNNRQNDWLTLREADRNDLWLHSKNIPGTHVIISLPKNIKSIHDLPDKTLEEAATLASYYSKGRDSEKVEVDYTFRYNVNKPAGSKPGMVIYDNYWTILVNPCVELLQEKEGE